MRNPAWRGLGPETFWLRLQSEGQGGWWQVHPIFSLLSFPFCLSAKIGSGSRIMTQQLEPCCPSAASGLHQRGPCSSVEPLGVLWGCLLPIISWNPAAAPGDRPCFSVPTACAPPSPQVKGFFTSPVDRRVLHIVGA